MEIFVAGATGILGKRVVRLLVDCGYTVKGIARSLDKAQQLKAWGAMAAGVDLFDVDQLIEATKTSQAILHLATSIPKKSMPKSKDWKLNDRIRVEGTRNLVLAAKANGINTFIGQSITALYGQQDSKSVSHTTPLPQNQIKMLRSAVEMEQIIQRGMADDFCLLRYGTFYCSDAFHTQDLMKSIKNGKFPLIGKGDFFWNFIHADDAANAILYCLEHYDQLKGQIHNITDFHPVLFRDMLLEVGNMTQGKRPIKLPHWLVKMMLGKDVYGFITNSYRVVRSQELTGLKITRQDFLTETRNI